MNVNRIVTDLHGLGFSANEKLGKIGKQEILTIVFTKGKLELETENIERVNVYNCSMTIYLKDNSMKFINLNNVTYME
ncbi:MAG: hypothetical protein J6Y78_11275 [Paludibacteraceae bacterium]|nr:hypothetical protein [Paludibacteraceae bacterium]